MLGYCSIVEGCFLSAFFECGSWLNGGFETKGIFDRESSES
jgi:hypothetical protein